VTARLVLPLLLFASSLTVMAGATIAPSLPGLRDHFIALPNVDLLVRLVLTIPGLAIALAAPLAGGVADRFGRKPVLFAGILLYCVAGASGLVLDDIWTILIGRVLLGFAVGMVMTSASALLADLYTGPERERVFGLQAAFMGFGGVLFLLGGGWLAEFGWRGPFAVYLLPLLILPLVLTAIIEPPATDLPAGEQPPLPFGGLAVIYGTAFLGMITFYIIPVQLPFLLRSLGAPAPLLAGAGIATTSLVSALTSLLLLKAIRARLSVQSALVLAYAAITCGYVVIATAAAPPQVFAGLALTGLGFGLQMPLLVGWMQSIIPPTMRGRAAGLYTMAVFFGQFVSPFVHAPAAQLVGYSASYAVAAALAAALALFMLAQKQRTA
jgi:MFS family permease